MKKTGKDVMLERSAALLYRVGQKSKDPAIAKACLLQFSHCLWALDIKEYRGIKSKPPQNIDPNYHPTKMFPANGNHKINFDIKNRIKNEP